MLMVSAGLRAQAPTTLTNTVIIDLNDAEYSNESFSSILDQYKGKVVYLDFWASWCGPCKREMPYSLRLQEKFKDQDVVFLYISLDRNAAPWRNEIEKLKITGQHYRANSKVQQQLNQQFSVRSIPRYVLIDKKGKVVSDNANRPSNPALVNDINRLLR